MVLLVDRRCTWVSFGFVNAFVLGMRFDCYELASLERYLVRPLNAVVAPQAKGSTRRSLP